MPHAPFPPPPNGPFYDVVHTRRWYANEYKPGVSEMTRWVQATNGMDYIVKGIGPQPC